MYTAMPLPHPYIGYFIPLILLTVLLISSVFVVTVVAKAQYPEEPWYGIALDIFKPIATIFYGLWFFFTAIMFAQNWDEPNPKNEKVVLRLVGETNHWVQYGSPVGNVSIRKSPGKTYPEYGIFYKN